MADHLTLRLEAVKARKAEILNELEQAEDVLSRDGDDAPDDETRTATVATVNELESEARDLMAEQADLVDKIKIRAELAAAIPDLPTIDGAPTQTTGRVTGPYDPDLADRAWSPAAKTELRQAAAEAVAETADWELDNDNKDRITRMVQQDSHVARLVIATGSDVYKRAFMKALTGKHYLMDADEQAAVARAAALSPDTAGGFAVPFPIDPTLIVTGDGSTNPVRSVARVQQITTDSWQGVAAGPIAFSWDGEAAEVSDGTPTWSQPIVPTHKAQGFVPFSIEIGMDYPNFAGDLAQLFAQGKDDLEAVAFITGTGTNQPTGIVTALTGTSREITSATTDVFAAQDVDATHEKLGPKYRNMTRSVWLANVAIQNDIRAFGSTDNRFTIDLVGERIPALFGRDILEASAMDGVIDAAADNRVLVFGDFQNYVIADRAGFNLELVPHMFDTANNRPSGQRGWYGWWRTGGDSVNDDGFAMLNVT